MWAKISTSTVSVACAACIATAATLPVMGAAAEEAAARISSADVKLAVDLSQLAAFNAIPAYIGLLGGDLTHWQTSMGLAGFTHTWRCSAVTR